MSTQRVYKVVEGPLGTERRIAVEVESDVELCEFCGEKYTDDHECICKRFFDLDDKTCAGDCCWGGGTNIWDETQEVQS